MERSYLLIFGSGAEDVIHEYGKQFSYSSNTSSSCTVWATTCRLSGLFGLVYPGSSHRVYNIEYSQLVCPGCFLEVGVYLLDQNGFGLLTVSMA